MDETASNLQNFIAICNSVDWCGLVIYDLMIALEMLSAFLLAIGMLCIYLTLNHHRNISPQYMTVAPQYISVALQYTTVAPHPTAIATLYRTASFQYKAALRFRDKCRPILLASVQLSIKLILSLSLVS